MSPSTSATRTKPTSRRGRCRWTRCTWPQPPWTRSTGSTQQPGPPTTASVADGTRSVATSALYAALATEGPGICTSPATRCAGRPYRGIPRADRPRRRRAGARRSRKLRAPASGRAHHARAGAGHALHPRQLRRFMTPAARNHPDQQRRGCRLGHTPQAAGAAELAAEQVPTGGDAPRSRSKPGGWMSGSSAEPSSWLVAGGGDHGGVMVARMPHAASGRLDAAVADDAVEAADDGGVVGGSDCKVTCRDSGAHACPTWSSRSDGCARSPTKLTTASGRVQPDSCEVRAGPAVGRPGAVASG